MRITITNPKKSSEDILVLSYVHSALALTYIDSKQLKPGERTSVEVNSTHGFKVEQM